MSPFPGARQSLVRAVSSGASCTMLGNAGVGALAWCVSVCMGVSRAAPSIAPWAAVPR